jgi:hypothetical protein
MQLVVTAPGLRGFVVLTRVRINLLATAQINQMG